VINRAARTIVLALSGAILLYVGVGYALGKTSEDRTYRSLGVFSEVLQHVQQDYVEDPNMQVVTLGALHGLLESLDSQSGYLSPREYTDFQKRSRAGSRGDVGAVLAKRFGYVVVLATLPDSPAHKAGLRSGDILESIAGFGTRDISIRQAELLLAGDPGTVVKLTEIPRRRTESKSLEMTRVVLPPAKLLADRLEGDIAYLSVPTLAAGRAAEIRQKLAELSKQGAQELILDLRDCASGDPAEAIETARLFLPSGAITTLRGQAVTTKEFTVQPGKAVWTGPLSVLISNSTAGAAEILAAALADNKRGATIGARTFGVASEQRIMPLDDGGALVLTTALYYTPAGKSINSEGVAPSVEVAVSIDDSADQLDEDGAPGTAETPSTGISLRPHDDPVLKKAIELLKSAAKKAT